MVELQTRAGPRDASADTEAEIASSQGEIAHKTSEVSRTADETAPAADTDSKRSADSSGETPTIDSGGQASHWPSRRLLAIAAASLLGLFLLSIFYTLYFVQSVLFPITMAVLLKLIFAPVILRLKKWRIPNYAGAGFVVGGILAATVTGIVLLSGPASEWLNEAPRHFRSVEFKLRSLKAPIEKVSDAGSEVDQLTNMDGEGDKPTPVQVERPGIVASVLDATGEVAVGTFLTLVLLYFLLAGGDRFLEKLIELAPAWQHKRNLVRLVRDVQQSMSFYLFATTCINIVLGILIGTVMWLLGLPNPILWGVMAGCLNFIPYLGCIVGAVIVCLVALVSHDSTATAVWAPALYIAINALEGYFITPAVLGRSISLSPLSILISMIVWGWIWGVGGTLIAVPILAAVKIACEHVEPLHPVAKLLGR